MAIARTQVVDSATAVTLLAAAVPPITRRSVTIQNLSALILFIGLGPTAPTVTDCNVRLAQFDKYELPKVDKDGTCYQGQVQGIWSGATSGLKALVTEIT